ncbi:MAG: hypothetical protein M1832_000624 [Thelocarpon impressellum]|nr:MAG: hypothetical protein M1832_000624 [Thelocarpon impressellum]
MADRAATRSSRRRNLTSSPGKPPARATRSTKAAAQAAASGEAGTSEAPPDASQPDVSQETRGTRPASDRSPGGLSNVSGTTALTSHSAQELALLDADALVDELADLSKAAGKLLALVAPRHATAAAVAAVARDVQVPGSRTGRTLHRLERNFQRHREHYGTDHYVDVGLVLKALYGVRQAREAPVGPARPDAVVQKANVAGLVTGALVSRREGRETHPALQHLELCFPAPFLSAFAVRPDDAVGTSSLLPETFELGLEIRTQLVIAMLSVHQTDPHLDPDRILSYVFMEEAGADGARTAKIRGWDFAGLGGGDTDMPDAFGHASRQRVLDIRSFFQDDPEARHAGDAVDSEGLERRFPWAEYIAKVALWGRARADEIESQLDAQGGAERVAEVLKAEVERRQSLDGRKDGQGRDPIRQTHEPETRRNGGALGGLLPAAEIEKLARQSFNSSSGVKALKRRESARRTAHTEAPPPLGSNAPARDDGTAAMSAGPPEDQVDVPLAAPARPSADPPAQALQDDDWAPARMDDNEDVYGDHYAGAPPPPTSSAQVLTGYERQQREKNKENRGVEAGGPPRRRRLIDRQENAQRVEFDDGLDETQPREGKRASPERVGEDEEDEEDDDSELSQDAGFEHDRRPVDRDRRRADPASPRREPIGTTPSRKGPTRAPRRPHRSEDDDDITSPEDQARAARGAKRKPPTASPQQRRHVTPSLASAGAAAAADDDDAAIDFSEVSTLAKRVAATRAPGKVQVRRAWGAAETARFVAYVEDERFGVSWSKIEGAKDPLLRGRGQVALKDKARNLKADFLKAGLPLPVNFEHVRLNAQQMRALHELGIAYQQ